MILIQSAGILALALIIAALSRRARASIRHLVLASAFVAVLVLPVLPRISIQSPVRIPVHVSIAQSAPPVAPTSRSAPSSSLSIPWDAILRVAWLSVIAVFFACLVIDLVRLYRLRRHGLPCPELSRGGIEVLIHENVIRAQPQRTK